MKVTFPNGFSFDIEGNTASSLSVPSYQAYTMEQGSKDYWTLRDEIFRIEQRQQTELQKIRLLLTKRKPKTKKTAK